MKKGFTLAEVLITLAIIGIVAALTIPTVVHKYQQKAYYTAFMKSYNALSTAFSMGLAEYGNPVVDKTDPNSLADLFQKYFVKNLKVAQSCQGNAAACGIGENTPLKALNSSDIGVTLYYFVNAFPSVLLQDGTIVLYNTGEDNDIAVDTNGGKGPNMFGRDIFMFEVQPLKDGVYKFYPKYLYTDPSNNEMITLALTKNFQGFEQASCSNESYALGNLCAARLLLEGKMDY